VSERGSGTRAHWVRARTRTRTRMACRMGTLPCTRARISCISSSWCAMPWYPWTCESQRMHSDQGPLIQTSSTGPHLLPHSSMCVCRGPAGDSFNGRPCRGPAGDFVLEIDLAGARAAHSFLEINLAGTFSDLLSRQGKAVLRYAAVHCSSGVGLGFSCSTTRARSQRCTQRT
jgi:hypothetical protein